MFAVFIAMLSVGVFIAAIMYDHNRRKKWDSVGSGVWMQRRVSKRRAYFMFRTSDAISPSSLTPALWEIRKPFSDKPQYISQHPEQLQAWWEPLTIQFSALGRNPKHIVTLGFSPALGIYLLADDTKKTIRPPGEELMVLLLQDARNTWKPRRFEVDSSYPIRESLMRNWHWPFALGMGILLHGLIRYSYVDFMGDWYYVVLGLSMALLVGTSLVFWYYHKMEGSIYRMKTLGHILFMTLACLATTLPFALIWFNMLSPQTVCDIPAPVTEWYSHSGKSRTYHATLNLSECSNKHVPARLSIKVSRADYQQRNKMNIGVSRGLLGRYYLDIKKSDKRQ